MKQILLTFILVICKEVLSDHHQSAQDEYFHRAKRQSGSLESCEQCGLSFETAPRVPVIINGTNLASPQKYPWMVALIDTGTDHIFCGGAIINQNFILTAGHCVVDIAVRSGMVDMKDLKSRSKCEGENCESLFMSNHKVTIGFLTPGWYEGVKPMTGVADIMVHPDYYYDWGKAHDIALIKMLRPIRCNRYANPICLPPRNVILEAGQLVKITGYGQTDAEHPVPTQELNEATIEILDKMKCTNMGFWDEDLQKMICLKGYKGQTPCFGDSGGSMFGKLYGESYVTLGVASVHSSPVCDSRASVVYTSVIYHLPWIYEMMGGRNFGAMKWTGRGNGTSEKRTTKKGCSRKRTTTRRSRTNRNG